MKKVFKQFVPKSAILLYKTTRSMIDWWKRDFLEYSPSIVKQRVLLKHAVRDAAWVETGTYLGEMTDYLRQGFPHVYSVEPERKLYVAACKRFAGTNVTLFNDVSENVFPSLLPTLNGDINFWLDGHYSGGITFQGDIDCPIKSELQSIKKEIDNFSRLTIFIDDVRCFLASSTEYSDYPSLDYLVDWARCMNMSWRIEHDIFVMQKH